IEIDPAAAVAVVDLAGPLAPGGGVVPYPAGADARQRRIELRLTDKEGVMLRPELLAIGEIERDAVRGSDRHEMAPFRPGFQVQNVGEKFGGGPFVPRRDDRVIELDTHSLSPSQALGDLFGQPRQVVGGIAKAVLND